MTDAPQDGPARSAALAIHPELTIRAAPHGGFAVYRPRHMVAACEIPDDELLFAGDIGSCMTFIVKEMVPPLPVNAPCAATAELERRAAYARAVPAVDYSEQAPRHREPNAFARKLNEALRPISDDDGA